MTDKEKFESYLKKANNGDSNAQCWVGYFYEMGSGVAKNLTEAVKWYKKSAEQGNASAQNNLGLCYYKGRGVKKNTRKAIKLYKKSAEQGNEKAIKNLENLFVPVYDYNHAVGGSKVVKALWIIWIVLSIGFLGYSAINGFSFFKNLPNVRTDFLTYVINGGIYQSFFLIMSLWGVSQLIVIPEILKGSRTFKTPRKIYFTYLIVIVITVIYYVINGFINGFNFGNIITTILIELILMFFTITSAKSIVYFEYTGLEIYTFVSIFFFFLSSWLKAKDKGFLSVLAAIPVIFLVVITAICLIAEIFEEKVDLNDRIENVKRERKQQSSRNVQLENKEQPKEEPKKEEPKKVEPKQDLKYYHYKTEISSKPVGEPHKTSISGLYAQKFDVDCTFYFKNCKGKEKTEKAYYSVSVDQPFTPTAKDAEELYRYMLKPKD